MNVALISLGCAKNLFDSELILGNLKSNNIEITDKYELADIIIVNTCGFIKQAKEESINTIMQLLQYQSFGKKIVITGCLVERYLDDLKKLIPEVDLFIPLRDYNQFGKIISDLIGEKFSKFSLSPYDRIISTPKSYGYLKISDGCNHRCSYCAIPLIRKDFVSIPIDELVKQALDMESKGIKELILISQDTTNYGFDIYHKKSLSQLLKRLDEETNFTLIRFLYTYPLEIDAELLNVVKNSQKIAKYFDVPIQHSSDKILKAMYRVGRKEDITRTLDLIRTTIPEAIIRTTLIVGFPGETDEDFKDVKDFIIAQEFDHLGVFTYSKEEDTPAFNFKNKVSLKTAEERKKELYEVQQNIAFTKLRKYINKVVQVIIDGFDSLRNMYISHNYAFSPDDVDGVIYVENAQELAIGTVINVTIINVDNYDLLAIIENE